jgi:two-component system sensor histidine kinase/response regulator
MGGTVGVESELGKGSTFWFTARLGKSKNQPRALIPAADLRGKHVLVVDDSSSARAAMAHMLSSMSFRVDEAASGGAAIEAIRRADTAGDPYTVVTLDWQMPQMDGLEAARRISGMQLSSRPLLVLVTAFNREDAISGARASGVSEILTKPVSPSLLFDTMIHLLSRDSGDQTSLTRAVPGSSRRAGSAEEETRKAQLVGIRVLLVEDNDINQEVAAGLLESGGVLVDIAENGSAAIEMLQAAEDNTYAAVLMDVQMSVMDGLTATRIIRGIPRFQSLPIIAMTANATSQDRDECTAAGMDDHIPKPIEEDVLWETLSRHIKPGSAIVNLPPVTEQPSASSGSPETIPSIPGLDIADGLRHVLGNADTYRMVLRKFAQGQRSAPAKIMQSLADEDLVGVERVAHTLKGLAGTIGASMLGRRAAEVEQLAHEGSSRSEIEAAVADLREVLEPLIEQLDLAFAPPPARPPAPANPELVVETCRNLLALLEDNDPEAVTVLENAADLLKTAASDQFEALQANINAYEFEAAKNTVSLILQHHFSNSDSMPGALEGTS